jgi:hypothetical protein
VRPISVATAFARAWTATYTIGLPQELRDRRRQEIAADVWEQEHHDNTDARGVASATHLAARVVRGMPADVSWRSRERRQRGRTELLEFAVNPTWEIRGRSMGRAALVALIALCIPIVVGLPLLLAITLPVGALAICQLHRNSKKVGIVTDTVNTRQRRTRAAVVVLSIGLFILGLVINSLPSQDTHDKYWALFVAPSMIAFLVGAVALPMCVWSWLPRRHDSDARP